MTNALVLADIRAGSLIRLGALLCRVSETLNHGAVVRLVTEDGAEQAIDIPSGQLWARFCEGEARNVDPIARPDLAASMPPVTLASLSVAAKIDWYHRMIPLRALMAASMHAPKSAEFQRAYSDAQKLLDWVRVNGGISSTKKWSAKRLNDVLRDWRRHGGAIAALLVQAVPARRKRPVDPKTQEYRELVHATTKTMPFASTATVHRASGAAARKKHSTGRA